MVIPARWRWTGCALVLVGLGLSLSIDSGWKARAVFAIFGLVGALITYGWPRVTTSRTRLMTGLVVFTCGVAVAVFTEPTLRSYFGVLAISMLAFLVAHGGRRRSGAGDALDDHVVD